uniref:HIT domain-containing protein n=1 Tax=Cyprinus carpio TaxID=7962 RepID=A0A8C2C0P9_CYPCA
MAMLRFGQHIIKSSAVFLKTELSFALVNRKPVVPGHLKGVFPKIHQHINFPTQGNNILDFVYTTQRGAYKALPHFGASDHITFMLMPAYRPLVKHVHVHVLPRKAPALKKNDSIFDEKHDWESEDVPTKWRSEEEMAKEATELRSLFS